MVTIAPTSLDLASRLRPVVLQLARELRRELAPLGITGGQAALLAAIRKDPGIGVAGLAAREGTSVPVMSGYVARLEAAGLVQRTRSTVDRRRYGLTLTDAGERITRAARRRRTAWLAARLERLPDDDRATIEEALAPLERLLLDAE